jgi:hypothetical protein
MDEQLQGLPPGTLQVVYGDYCFSFKADGFDGFEATTDKGDVPGRQLYRIVRAQHPIKADYTAWAMVIPTGKHWVTALDCEPFEKDASIIMLKSILHYKELGYGEGLKW